MKRFVAALLPFLVHYAGAQTLCQQDSLSPGKWQLNVDRGLQISDDSNGRGATLKSVPNKGELDSCGKAARASSGPSTKAWIAVPRVEYEGGDADERGARVRSDDGAGERFVRFSISDANVRNRAGKAIKARVQVNLYGNKQLHRYAQEVQLRLGPGFEVLLDQPGAVDWLTVGEWWNEAPWVQRTRGFRVSLNLTKPAGESERAWALAAHGQAMDASGKWLPPAWRTSSQPVLGSGQWARLQVLLEEGDEKNGRFLVALVENERTTVLIDVRGRTRHDDLPDQDGWVHVNPVKLYTSKPVIDAVKRGGQQLSLDWRGLQVLDCNVAKDEPACKLAGSR